MKKALKAKWVAALRSGEYKQYKEGALRSADEGYSGFCCLGVLCEISPAVNSKNRDGSYLSTAACEYAGLTDQQQHDLANLNDDGKDGVPYGFKRIATYIEKNL